jgi:hypothetical protein
LIKRTFEGVDCLIINNDLDSLVSVEECQPGLPDGFFQTKNPYLGKFWRALEWKMLVYFMTFWNILWPFGIIYGRLV